MKPILILGALAGLGLLALRSDKPPTHPASDWKPHPDASKTDPFPDGNKPANLELPPPPPKPDGSPPDGVQDPEKLGWRLFFDKSLTTPNKMTAVYFEDKATMGEDVAGADALPLVWIAPDGSSAAILWVQHPAYGMKELIPGKLYWAKPMATDLFPEQVRQRAIETNART